MFLGILFYRLGFLTVRDNDTTPHVASYEQSTLHGSLSDRKRRGLI
jgi:hypothetical protein